MPRDYAKQRPRYHNNVPRAGAMPWLWLLLGLLLGIGVAFFMIKNHASDLNSKLPEKLAVTAHQSKTDMQKKSVRHHAKTHTATKTSPAQHQFDFYTLLPQTEVDTSPANDKSSDPKTLVTPSKLTASAPTNKNTTRYILQIAAFSNYADADTVRAQLVLMGFEPNIKTMKSRGTTWNRVWMGPYPTPAVAKTMQQQLQQNHIKSILVRIS